jgi:hypothetical protein
MLRLPQNTRLPYRKQLVFETWVSERWELAVICTCIGVRQLLEGCFVSALRGSFISFLVRGAERAWLL